jgi:hypothetical protein
MRYVIYTDKNGYKKRSLLRDSDGDELAPYGIPAGPPSLEEIDFEEIKKQVNNLFVENGIFTWDDVQKNQIGLQAVCTIVKRYVAVAFKESAKRDENLRNLT